MNNPFDNWLAEEGITLVHADKQTFSDPAIYLVPEIGVRVVSFGDDIDSARDKFAEQIKGLKILCNNRVIQCPNNWGENYDFSEKGLM